MQKFLGLIVIIIVVVSCNPRKTNKTDLEEVKDTVIISDTLKALSGLSDQIRDNPRNHKLFYERAELQYASNNIPEAVNDLEIALRLDSANSVYMNELGVYYLKAGSSGKAKEILEKCEQIYPDNRDALFQLAQLYYYVQQYNDALLYIGKIESLNKQADDTYFLKALIYKENGNYEASLKSLRKTLEFNPNHWEAYNIIGLLYYEKQDALAVEYYNTAVNLFPNNIEICLNAAITYQKFGKVNESIYEYQHVLELDSLNFRAYYNLGYIYLVHSENYLEAVNSFTHAIAIDSSACEAFYNRGYAYELLGNFDFAKRDYQKSLQIVPNYSLAIEGLNSIDKILQN
jgi:tetratricopeptide (TPR) repeat protein